jgi:hypothetical protein
MNQNGDRPLRELGDTDRRFFTNWLRDLSLTAMIDLLFILTMRLRDRQAKQP